MPSNRRQPPPELADRHTPVPSPCTPTDPYVVGLKMLARRELSTTQVRERLRAWFAAAPADVFDKTIPTYYGEQWVHLHLERTTWHSGQHLRQAYDLLERDGSLPVPPLAAELFEGLPMPAELW